MKRKLKLIAIVYGTEDKEIISNWLHEHKEQFEIFHWSSYLSVPLQTAVSHFQSFENIDGLVIDDHKIYDPIVLSQIENILLLKELPLFSAKSGKEAVIGTTKKTYDQGILLKLSAPTILYEQVDSKEKIAV